jgi:superfamily II helicase
MVGRLQAPEPAGRAVVLGVRPPYQRINLGHTWSTWLLSLLRVLRWICASADHLVPGVAVVVTDTGGVDVIIDPDKVVKLPKRVERCLKCKREIKTPNRLVNLPGMQTKWCLICHEEEAHKDIMSYLAGKGTPTFICSNIGQEDAECDVMFVAGRNYLTLHTTDELLEEVQRRIKEGHDTQ